MNRFWVFTGKSAAGPYDPVRLKGLPGFGPGTVVAPEGAATEDAWKPAREFPELRAFFAGAQPPTAPVARSAAGRTPKPAPAAKPSSARPVHAPRPAKHPHPAPAPAAAPHAGARSPGPARKRPLAKLFGGRMPWVLAAAAGAALLASVLYSLFERLGRETVPAAAAPSPAASQRPMPFEAPGSLLLKKRAAPPAP